MDNYNDNSYIEIQKWLNNRYRHKLLEHEKSNTISKTSSRQKFPSRYIIKQREQKSQNETMFIRFCNSIIGKINHTSKMWISQSDKELRFKSIVERVINSDYDSENVIDYIGKYIDISIEDHRIFNIILNTYKKNLSTRFAISDKPKRIKIPSRVRYKVIERDGRKCCICGRSPITDKSVELHVDHKVPVSKGGTNNLKNLQTLCSECNLGKSNRPVRK